jgi:hypothetical protein
MSTHIKASKLEVGPIRHPALSNDLVDRVKRFKAILGDVDGATLEKTIDAFQRDAHPGDELIIWERIANTFQMFLAHHRNAQLVRKDVYAVLVKASMGDDGWSDIKHLTKDEINHLVFNYRGL